MTIRTNITLSLTCMIALTSAPCAAINFRPLITFAAQLNNRKVIIPALLCAGAAYLLSKYLLPRISTYLRKSSVRAHGTRSTTNNGHQQQQQSQATTTSNTSSTQKVQQQPLLSSQHITKAIALPANFDALLIDNQRGRVILQACGAGEAPSLTYTADEAEATIPVLGGSQNIDNRTVFCVINNKAAYDGKQQPPYIHYTIKVPATTIVRITTREDFPWDKTPHAVTVDGFIKRVNQNLSISTNPGNTICIKNTDHPLLSDGSSANAKRYGHILWVSNPDGIVRNGTYSFKYWEEIGADGRPAHYNVEQNRGEGCIGFAM